MLRECLDSILWYFSIDFGHPFMWLTMGLAYTPEDLLRIRDSMSQTVSPVLLYQLSSLVRRRSGGLRHARPIPVFITTQTFDNSGFYPEWHPGKQNFATLIITSSRQKLKCALLNAEILMNPRTFPSSPWMNRATFHRLISYLSQKHNHPRPKEEGKSFD